MTAAARAPDPAAVEIALHGPLALRTAGGADRTPRPQKVRALVALLATAPDGRRSRRWVEERLWSDRGPAQAAGSLRQALVDLRRALGEDEALLLADRETVGLAPGLWRLADPEPGREFLEGIGVRDPAFLRWLDGMRRREAAAREGVAALARPDRDQPAAAEAPPAEAAAAADPLVLRFGTSNLPGTASGLAGEIIASRIAGDIAERVTAVTLARPAGRVAGGQGADLDITCNVVEDNGVCLAYLQVIQPGSGKTLYARDFRFVGTAATLVGNDEVQRAAFEAAERTVGRIPILIGLRKPALHAAALGQLALHRMFTFDETRLAEADRLMEAAWEVEENPVTLAWRGLLQMVTAIERPQAARADLAERAEAMTAQAIARDRETAAGNATVRALVAQTRAMLWGDAAAAGEAARAALDENPRNPLALQAMAVAHMLAGEGEAAYRLSHLGRNLAGRSAFRHWWDAHHATVCVATGRYPEAIAAAEAARGGAPSLRPAYRYLMSLYAQRGDLDRAEAMRAQLEALEPGFALDRMLNDPDYPVRTLRRTGLLKEVRKLL
jgi:hypothetical protein